MWNRLYIHCQLENLLQSVKRLVFSNYTLFGLVTSATSSPSISFALLIANAHGICPWNVIPSLLARSCFDDPIQSPGIFSLVAQGDRQHDRHVASDAQMHGGFVVEEVVVEQKVASHACVDSLQGVSQVKNLLPFPGVAQTWTEDAYGMLSVVEQNADYSLSRAKTKFDAVPASIRIRQGHHRFLLPHLDSGHARSFHAEIKR